MVPRDIGWHEQYCANIPKIVIRPKHPHHHTLQSEESTLRARTEKSLPCFNITCRRVAKRPSRHSLECKFYVHRSIYLVLCSSTYQVLCMLGIPALRGAMHARARCTSGLQGGITAGHSYCKSTVWARRKVRRRSMPNTISLSLSLPFRLAPEAAPVAGFRTSRMPPLAKMLEVSIMIGLPATVKLTSTIRR